MTPYHPDIQSAATLYIELVTICYPLQTAAPPSAVTFNEVHPVTGRLSGLRISVLYTFNAFLNTVSGKGRPEPEISLKVIIQADVLLNSESEIVDSA